MQYDQKFAKKLQNYSVGALLRGLLDPTSREGGLELEVSAELARNHPGKPQGTLVPWGVLAKRDLVVGTATAGGHTVATSMMAKNFVSLLRPTSIIANLGATQLTGLAGNVAVPRQTAASTAYWVAENGAPTESQQAFDQVPMTPKTLGAFVDISRRMLLQSSLDISSFVLADLRASLGQELDRVALNGSGSGNEPAGILNNAGIATVALGTNGAALTWADIVNLETQVAIANADGENCAYVTTKNARGKLLNTQKVAVSGADMIWQPAQSAQLAGEGVVNGYRAIATTLVPNNLTKGSSSGVCSAMIYGNWRDLLVGQWGAGIDLIVDPFSFSTTGAVRLVALTDVDIAVRHPESFIKIKDVLTT